MDISGGGSLRILGAALILLSGSAGYYSFSRSVQREQILLRDVIGALEQLAGSIRWRNLSLPEGIAELSDREFSGKYFKAVINNMASNMTLHDAWRLAFSQYCGEDGDILRRIELEGDAQRVIGSLCQCVETLEAHYRQRQNELRQRKRLCAAGLFSAAGILVVILA